MRLRPKTPVRKRRIPKPPKTSVGFKDPAGAKVEPAADAILSGKAPIVKVKLTEVLASATTIVLSPERSAVGVYDQFPEASAVTPVLVPFTVTSTVPEAVVRPEKVGRVDET